MNTYKSGIQLFALIISLLLTSNIASAKKVKKTKHITFEQCCTKHKGNSKTCQNKKGVSKKRKKVGKKWVNKTCPAIKVSKKSKPKKKTKAKKRKKVMPKKQMKKEPEIIKEKSLPTDEDMNDVFNSESQDDAITE